MRRLFASALCVSLLLQGSSAFALGKLVVVAGNSAGAPVFVRAAQPQFGGTAGPSLLGYRAPQFGFRPSGLRYRRPSLGGSVGGGVSRNTDFPNPSPALRAPFRLRSGQASPLREEGVAQALRARTEARIGSAFFGLDRAFATGNGAAPAERPLEVGWTAIGPALDPSSALRAPSPGSAGRRESGSREQSLRAILRGTAAYKLGMDALAVAVPLALGSASWVAVFMAVWNVSQAVTSSSAEGLFRRWAPQKVMTGALGVQAAAVSVLFALMLSHAFLPAVVLPLYTVAGMAQGAVETARRVLPRAVLGPDQGLIEAFNSKTHFSYESAGVLGAVGAALAIGAFGVPAAVVVNPLAFLAAAWYFRKVQPQFAWEPANGTLSPSPSPTSGRGEIGERLGARFREYLEAGRKLWGDRGLRALSLALVLPQAMHRLLEGFAFPQYSKAVLEDPAQSGWLMGASNAGELLGAMLLIKVALTQSSLARPWVRATALASLGLWLMAFSAPWPLLLPFIALQSTLWAGSDLKLSAELQAHPRVTPREIGFLFACYLIVVTALSLGLGAVFDAFGTGPGFIALNFLITSAAGWLFYRNGLRKTAEEGS